MSLTTPEEEEVAETVFPEHDWQLDSPTRAYLRTSAVEADELPILHHNEIVRSFLTSYNLYSDINCINLSPNEPEEVTWAFLVDFRAVRFSPESSVVPD